MASKSGINRIAVIDPNGQLVTIAPDGADRRELTDQERVFQFPAWSPDNTVIAVIGSTEHEAGVVLVREQGLFFGPASRRIYTSHTQPPVYLSWAPDGATITMLAVHPTHRLGIYLLSPETDEQRQTRDPIIGGQPCFWDWQKDGRGLLVHTDLGRQEARLTSVRWKTIASSTVKPIDVTPGHFQSPGFSTDGHYIAYAQLDAAGQSQLVASTREKKYVLAEYDGIAALGWSPAGNALAFIHAVAAAQHFYGPLRIWNAEHQTIELLNEGPVLAFFWSPTGRHIAYLTADASGDISIADTPGYLTNGRFTGSWPLLKTPQTQQLELNLSVVEVSSGHTRMLVRFEPHALFVNQFLPFFDQYAKSHPIWSPDGDALVLPMAQDDQAMICIVPLAGGDVRPITPGLMATWSW
jgi:TolB protein